MKEDRGEICKTAPKREGTCRKTASPTGADGRIRTGDLILTNFKGGRSDSVVLCHLYNPKFVFFVRPVQIMPH